MLSPSRRVEALVFALTLWGVAYFHQGGGWNQNVRFALVRAIVEEGKFAIDSFLVYGSALDGSETGKLIRYPLQRAAFERDGARYALAWRDARGELVPVDPEAAVERTLVDVDDVAASGDLAYFRGHFHPNKPPGTSFLAVPAYAVIRGVERLLGAPAERWWTLTRDAWLVSVFSVGLVTAFGAVLVLRLARRLAPERPAAFTALVFVFGSMTWPHGTLLLDHNVVGTALLAAFYCIECAYDRRFHPGAAGVLGPHAGLCLAYAGLCAGYAAISNYTIAGLVLVLWGYVLVRLRRWPAALWFGLGVAGPLLLICAYNQANFGTPFTTNYAYENTAFVSEDRALGLFALPRLDVLLALLFSPFRGLFFTSPVLVLGVVGLVFLLPGRAPQAWGWLIAAVSGFLLLVNASFNGWEGGWTAVPRHLGAAIPFLVLPIALAWDRWFRTTCLLAVASMTIQLLITAVDPQVPIGDVGVARVPVREVWWVNPLAHYVLPLFLRGRAWPILDERVDQTVVRSELQGRMQGVPAAERAQQAAELRADLRARIERGEETPFPLAGVAGPVSANPIGMNEGKYYQIVRAGSPSAIYNSFNLGELLFPQSRLSLLPLLLLGGILATWLLRAAGCGPGAPTAARGESRSRRADRRRPGAPKRRRA